MKKINSFTAALLCFLLILLSGCSGAGQGVTEELTTEATAADTTGAVTETGSEPELLPQFSERGGYYGGPVTLSLSLPESAGEGTYVAYTENGDEPRPDQGKYAGVIEIGKTAVIRAALFSSSTIKISSPIFALLTFFK